MVNSAIVHNNIKVMLAGLVQDIHDISNKTYSMICSCAFIWLFFLTLPILAYNNISMTAKLKQRIPIECCLDFFTLIILLHALYTYLP
ncbi:hypothetical protein AB4K20DRAFT_1926538 [Rhizopus microsporus]